MTDNEDFGYNIVAHHNNEPWPSIQYDNPDLSNLIIQIVTRERKFFDEIEKQLLNTITNLQKSTRTLENDKTNLINKIKCYNVELSNQCSKNDKLEEEIAILKNEILNPPNWETKIKYLKTDTEAKDAEIKALSDSNKRMRAILCSLKKENNLIRQQMKEENKIIPRKFKKSSKSQMQETCNEAFRQLQSLCDENIELKEENFKLHQNLDCSTLKNSELITSLTTTNLENKKLKEELSQNKNKLEKLKAKGSNLSEKYQRSQKMLKTASEQSKMEVEGLNRNFIEMEEKYSEIQFCYEKLMLKCEKMENRNKRDKIVINRLERENIKKSNEIENLLCLASGYEKEKSRQKQKILIPTRTPTRSTGVSPINFPKKKIPHNCALKREYNNVKKFNITLRCQLGEMRKSKIYLEKSYEEIRIQNKSLTTKLRIFRERWEISTKRNAPKIAKSLDPPKKETKMTKKSFDKIFRANLEKKHQQTVNLSSQSKELAKKLKDRDSVIEKIKQLVQSKNQECRRKQELIVNLQNKIKDGKDALQRLEETQAKENKNNEILLKEKIKIKNSNESLRTSLKTLKLELEKERGNNKDLARKVENLNELIKQSNAKNKEIEDNARNNEILFNKKFVEIDGHFMKFQMKVEQYEKFIKKLFDYIDHAIYLKSTKRPADVRRNEEIMKNYKAMNILGLSEEEFYQFVNPVKKFCSEKSQYFIKNVDIILKLEHGCSLSNSLWDLIVKAFKEIMPDN